MAKRIICSAIFIFSALSIFAGPVSKQQALSVAKSFFLNKGIEMKVQKDAYHAPRLNATTDQPAYYIFNAGNDKGFVIVSGDDSTPEIIGYTDSGTFDESTMPENMRGWLQHYAYKMKYLQQNRVANPNAYTDSINSVARVKKASQVRHSIPTLMTSTWNQGSPYNDKCPMYYNEDGSTGEHAATGCVATALAQVLYYYKHPEKTARRIPLLTNTYTLSDGTKKTVTVQAFKKGTVIDWDNLLDNYTGSETQEQKDAIADLMLIVGSAVRMGYGASSGAAFGNNVAEMYHDYFDFDDKAYAADRGDYSATEWFNLIYNELDGGHPIPMAGYTSEGGHSFVIDGFDGDNLFHINWGWGGMCDGYFRIDVMNPGDTSGMGASSSSDGYSMGECIIIGLDMPDEETTESRTHLSINDIAVTGTKIGASYINWTGNSGTFNYTIAKEDENGEIVPINSNIIKTSTLGINGWEHWDYDLNGNLTTPGTYKVSPASKLSKNSIWRPEYNMGSEYLEVVVGDNGKISTITKHPLEDIEVVDWNFITGLTKDKEQEVKVTFKNNGDEYYREVKLFASKDDNKVKTDCRCAVIAKSGETSTFSFYFTPDATGTWNLWLCEGDDGSGEIGHTTVTIGNTAKNQASLSVGSVNVSNSAYGNILAGTMTIKNNSQKAFAGYVKMTVWSNKESDGIYWWGGESKSIYYEIAAGSSSSASFEFDNLEIGKNYRFAQSYTTQDGDLDGGGIWDGSQWTLKKGFLTWGSTGVVGGSGSTTTASISSSVSGALFDNINISTINAGSNPNTIYAFTNGSKVPATLDGKNVVSNGEAESIAVIETKPMFCPVTFVAKKATFTHTVSVAGNGISGWDDITLPFKPIRVTIDGVEVEWKKGNDDGAFWLREFSEVNDNDEVVFADVESIDDLRGNTPYIICAPEDLIGKDIVFEGDSVSFVKTSTDNMMLSSDAFIQYGMTYNKRIGDVFILNETGDAYEYTADNKTLKAFNNYFVWRLDEESRPARIKIASDADGIRNINSVSAQQDRVYDLQGREVANPSNGIYIINGKKVIK